MRKISMPRAHLDEQETFIRYDKINRTWTLETNIYNHIERFKGALIDNDKLTLGYDDEDKLSYLAGEIDLASYRVIINAGTVKLSKKAQITPEEKKRLRERFMVNIKKAGGGK